MDATTVKKIGKYEIIDQLGRGGMGIVYLAEDKRIGRKVAIKTLTEGYTGQPDMLERFYREAQAGILQHPNIVTVFDLGDQDGIPFIVMDYVPGQALDKILASGRQLPLIERLSVIEQVCSALDYAHRNGVVHRDIKPANVMVEPTGRAKLVDFGIAHIKKTDDFTALTITGNVIGTLYYIAPERLNGQPYDGRSDIFATGVLLYQLITGHLPFAGEDSSVLHKIVNSPHPPLGTYISNYPAELDAILDRALAKDPEDRYATAEDFAVDLHSVSEGLKKGRVAGLFDNAERFTAEQQFGRAKEALQEVLKIEPSHTGARQLLGIVQKKLDLQSRAERVRQLVEQAEESLFSEQLTEAIGALEQAVKLDPANPDLKARLENARNKKAVAEQLITDLAQVEELRKNLDYTGALSILEKARSLDPKNSRVLATYVSVQKQVQASAQRGRVRELLETARQELLARRFTAAIAILTEIQGIDPSAPELEALRDKAVKGKEQEDRRRVLDEIQRRVSEYLSADNYSPAAELLNRALERLPNEPMLHRLKAEVDAELRKLEVKHFVDGAVARARELFATSPQEALAAIQKDIERMPTEERLLDFERFLRSQMDVARTERVRNESLAKARALLDRSQFDKAIGVLESYHLEFGSDSDVDDLLESAKNQQRRSRIDSLITEARALIRQERLDDAAVLLDSAIQETGDASFTRLLEEVREKQKAIVVKLDLLQKRVALLRERGELDEAIQTLQSFLTEAPGNRRAQDLLTALQAQREQKQVVSQAIAAARQALDRKDFAAGWESLQAVQRAYGDCPELTRATQEFQSARAVIAQQEVGKSIETARAALLKNEPEAALTALKAAAPMVEFADAVGQADWRRIGQSAKEALRRPEKTTGGAVLDELEPPTQDPKRRKVLIGAIAVGVLAVAVICVVIFSRRPQPPTHTSAEPPPPPAEAYVQLAKVPVGASITIDGVAPKVADANGELSIKLEPGSHHLVVSKGGFVPFPDDFTLRAGGTLKEIIPPLVPEGRPTGTLSFEGFPKEFTLFVNGEARTVRDGKPIELEVGSPKIGYSVQGYKESPGTRVSITRDKETPLIFKQLEKLPPPPVTATIPTAPATAAPPASAPAPAPQPTGTLSASPNTIERGKSATLSWQVNNAPSVAISNVGDALAPQGTKTVSPTDRTSYELRANGILLAQTEVDVTTPKVAVESKSEPPTPTSPAKPTGPTLAALEPALNAYKGVFTRASGASRKDCEASFNGNYQGKLHALSRWCELAKSFDAVEKCSDSPGGSPEVPTLQCSETIVLNLKDGTTQRFPGQKTFHFVNSGNSWQISKWD